MTTPAQPPIQAVPDFALDGADSYFLNAPVTFFTVPGDVPARIDAISMQILYPSKGIASDLYGIQYMVPGGALIGPVWTAQFATGEMSDNEEALFLTWMRYGTGSDQQPPSPFVQLGGVPFASFATGQFPLPDTVLPALTQVQIVRAHGGDFASPQVAVTGCTVTYTPGAGPTSETTAAQGIPLLTPTDNS